MRCPVTALFRQMWPNPDIWLKILAGAAGAQIDTPLLDTSLSILKTGLSRQSVALMLTTKRLGSRIKYSPKNEQIT